MKLSDFSALKGKTIIDTKYCGVNYSILIMDDGSKFGVETERTLYDLYGMRVEQLSDLEYNEICKD